MDNNSGLGVVVPDVVGDTFHLEWWVNESCPLHGDKPATLEAQAA